MNRRAFDQLVRQALRRIPDKFRQAMQELTIIVEDWPDPVLMEEVTGDPDEVLYGLFSGVSLSERHVDDSGDLPPVIYLYRGPLEDDFADADELAREIEITLVHEIAHFMGFDEDALEEYGYV